MRKRNQLLDFMKFLLSIFVITIHCQLFKDFQKNLYVGFTMGLARVAVPFFFVSSGYYYAKKVESNKPVRNYILKLIKLLLIYEGVEFIVMGYFVYPMYNNLFLLLFRCLSVGITGAYWYITSLLLTYVVVTPLWKRNKMSICIVVGLLLYFVAMTNDSYSSLFLGTNLQKLSLIHTQIWTWPQAGLGESLLFVSIGMKIYETNRQDRCNIYMLIVSFIMLFFESYFLQSMSPKDANCYISLIFCAPLLFIECLKKFRISFNTELLGKISMYIYMTHPIVLAIICNFVVFNNTFYKFFVVTFVTLLISIITYRLKNRRIL